MERHRQARNSDQEHENLPPGSHQREATSDEAANTNRGKPPPPSDEAANDNKKVRALRLRIGCEELVIISTPAWDPTIMGRLSRLQQKIVRVLTLGRTHKQVAPELGVQPQTVANSTSALYRHEDGLADTLEHLVSQMCTPFFEIEPE